MESWPIECKEVHVFNSAEEDNRSSQFSRRSEPNAAARAITVEQHNDGGAYVAGIGCTRAARIPERMRA